MNTKTPPSSSAAPPLTFDDIMAWLNAGCKPPADWRIGTEHEKFAYHKTTLMPLGYDEPNGVRDFLLAMQQFGWKPIYEGEHVIALKGNRGDSISLEPAGQIELSGAPLKSVHETCMEVNEHLFQVKKVANSMDIIFLGIGARPEKRPPTTPWMPKERYAIMRRYMPTRGTMGLEMMQHTCTVQVNMDFDTERTMVRMFRVALALQPIATALWAASPFSNGVPNGYLSYRSHVWTDTDNERTGMLPFVFEQGFGFERWADYILDVPMYFVYRNGRYIDASGQSFRDFMAGNLPALPGEYPTIKDWGDHITTAFPEVRLKQYLEMRGADSGPWNSLCALPAFWVGLLYDEQALAHCEALIGDWSVAEMNELRMQVPRDALNTLFRGTPLRTLAEKTLDIAHMGLKNRAVIDSMGMDETSFLRPLVHIVQRGHTLAEELLTAWNGDWHEDLSPLFREHIY